MAITTQLAIIGAGPGGYHAAFYAADQGLDVVLIDKMDKLGGVCLNMGCIPSKFLLHLARILRDTKECEKWGIHLGKAKIDLSQVAKGKEEVLEKLRKGLKSLAQSRKVRFLSGKAHFISPNKIGVENSKERQEVHFDSAIIATGSLPFIPPLFQIKSLRIWTSDQALDLPEIPKSMLLVGGGVIGLELGSVYSAFGSKVSLVEILEDIAPGVDADLKRTFKKALAPQFENIYTSTKVTQVEEKGKTWKVSFEGQEGKTWQEEFQVILVAAGRYANTEPLRLEKIGIKVEKNGKIPVDHGFATSLGHIYAIGDIVDGPMLAHKASFEAKVAVDKILGKNAQWDHRAMPYVIYTDPEVAWVGLTEEECKRKKIPYQVGRFPWSSSGRAMTFGKELGLTKVIADPEDGRLLGVGIVGRDGGELIGEAALAIEMGAFVEDLIGTIHAHPTLSETLLESCEDFYGLATHVFRKRRR